MPAEQIHFPTTKTVDDYTTMIEDLGGADVCYGGIGWCGHIAFYEPHLPAVRRRPRRLPPARRGSSSFRQSRSFKLPLRRCRQCRRLVVDAARPHDRAEGPGQLEAGQLLGRLRLRRIGLAAVHQPPCSPRAGHPIGPRSILQVLRSELILSGTVAADCSLQT